MPSPAKKQETYFFVFCFLFFVFCFSKNFFANPPMALRKCCFFMKRRRKYLCGNLFFQNPNVSEAHGVAVVLKGDFVGRGGVSEIFAVGLF